MHVGTDVSVTEWIGEHAIGAANPAAVESVLPIVHSAPADARGLKVLNCADDCLGNARRKKEGVVRIGPTSKTAHCRRCRVRMGGGNEHVPGQNTGGAAGLIL